MIKLSNEDIKLLTWYHSRAVSLTEKIEHSMDMHTKYGDMFPYDDDSIKHDLAIIRAVSTESQAIIHRLGRLKDEK